jgi:hypothetical protein
MTYQLRPDQIADLAILMNHPKHLHLSDPGTGKTPTICTYQRFLFEDQGTPSVWPQPKSLLEKNRDEALLWGGWSDPRDVQIVDGPLDVSASAYPAKVYLMGFQRFAMEQEKLPTAIRAIQIDEFHKGFGGMNSGQTQGLYRFMGRQGEFFTPMTGTLIDGKLETAFPAINVIEPRYYGSAESFTKFHTAYDPFTQKKIGYRHHDHLQTILRRHCIRRLFRDIFGEQEVVTQVEWLAMNEAQRKLYDTFEEDAIIELENFYITGQEPGVAFIRACQIMEHPNRFPNLLDPKGSSFIDISPGERPAKLDRLDLHLTDHLENKTPFLVYAAMVPQQHEAFELAESLGLKVGFIGGEASTKERNAVDKAFRAGELDGLVGSPLVADTGFNWQFSGEKEVNHIIFCSLPYKDVAYSQAVKRTIRQKRSQALRVTVLAYRDSLDIRKMQILQNKSADANRVDPTQEVLKFF